MTDHRRRNHRSAQHATKHIRPHIGMPGKIISAIPMKRAMRTGMWSRVMLASKPARAATTIKYAKDTMNDIVDAARKIRKLQSEQNQQRAGESDEDFESRAFDTLNIEYEWIGGISYRGNSVSWIHSKAQANGRALMAAWEALTDIGGVRDGKTTLADAIRKLQTKKPGSP